MICLIKILKSLVLVILLTVTLCECQTFLTSSDFKNADKLTAHEIDRGVGIVVIGPQFNVNLFGGDVVKSPAMRKDVNAYITRASGRHWKNGRVPYEFGGRFTFKERIHIAKAIQLLQRHTCIRVVPRIKTDRNYIKFVQKDGCYSVGIGRENIGRQEISLGSGCMRSDLIIHELMHALGFVHEFSRPDRNKYIVIKYENIDEQYKPQFHILSGPYFGDWKLPFDVKSVMFYENGVAARKPGLTTMIARNGQQLKCKPHACPTKLDIKKINTVYNCKNIKRTYKTRG